MQTISKMDFDKVPAVNPNNSFPKDETWPNIKTKELINQLLGSILF